MSIYDDITAAIVDGQPVSKAAFRQILEDIADLANALVSDDEIAGTSKTIGEADHGVILRFQSGSAVAAEFDKATPARSQGMWIQEGAGQLTFSIQSGGTLHNGYGFTKSFGQWASGGWVCTENSDGESAVIHVFGEMAP